MARGKDFLLKVALLRQGQVLQEAAVGSGTNVTVGRADSCTLKLPGERVPESFPIFLWENGQVHLRFSEAMPGVVRLAGGEVTAGALISGGRTRLVQGFHLFPLTGTEQGHLRLGDLELRFECQARSVGGPKVTVGERATAWLSRTLSRSRDTGPAPERKVLRVAVVRDNQILEERLVRKAGDVTIGTAERTTLKLPVPQAPESFRLFGYRRGRYVLRFSEAMTGKVAIRGEVLDLEALRGSKRVERKGKVFQLTLCEEDRGKVTLGEVSLLFQFVIPPRPVAIEELKTSRSGIADAIERLRIWASVSSTGRQSRGVMIGLLIAIAGTLAIGLGNLVLPWIEENTVQFERPSLFFGHGWMAGRIMLAGAGLALLVALTGLMLARKKLYAAIGMVLSIGVLTFAMAAPFVIRSFIRTQVAAGVFLETTRITMDTGYLVTVIGVALMVVGFVRALLADPVFGPDDRVLQIAYFWRDRLIREMVFQERRDVLAGLGRNSDLVLPLRSTRMMRLFRVDRNGDYWLALVEGMFGDLDVAGEQLPVAQFASREGARVDGVSYVHVRAGDSGLLHFGGTSLRFEFTRPPRAMVGRQPVLAMDGALVSSIVASLFAVASFYVVSQFLWNPTVPREERAERRTMSVEMNVAQEREERNLSIGEGEGVGATPAEGRFGNPDVEDEAPDKRRAKRAPETDEERQRRQMARVQNSTILKFLGPGGGSNQAGRAMTAVAGMGDAWNMGNQMAVVQEGGSGGFGGIGGGRAGGMAGTPGTTFQKMAASDMKGTGRLAASASKVTGGDKSDEVAVKIRVSGNLGSQGGTGKIDRASVESVFRRRKGAIQSCYERALKVNSQVQGKVVIRFTIGPAGTVTDISVAENSTGDSQIGACIAEKVRAWPFPPPDEGSVTFVYPFMLTSGG